jgi:hypothetical protein
MVDVLTRTVERRVLLAGRAERLRKELAEIDVEVARLEAAEVVFGQYAEATDGGRRDDPALEPAPVEAEGSRWWQRRGPAGCCSCLTASRA